MFALADQISARPMRSGLAALARDDWTADGWQWPVASPPSLRWGTHARAFDYV